jgi:hypothetical protein
MFTQITTITVLLIAGFLSSLAQANDQSKNAAQFAVCYTAKTKTEAHGVIVVTHSPEEMRPSGMRPSTAKFIVPFMAQDHPLVLQIYDLTGRHLYQAQPQNSQLIWNGRDQLHREVASGLYPFVIRATEPPEILEQAPTGVASNERLFEDVTAVSLPKDSSQSRDAEMGDLDGDGDLDVVVAHQAPGYGRQPQVLINGGSGAFINETGSRLPSLLTLTDDVDLADVDQDGDLDIYLANTNDGQGSPFADNLLINDGTGHFQDETALRISQDWIGTQNVAFGDVDGDGDDDLLVAPLFDGVRLLMNNGEGFFADSTKGRLDNSEYFSFDLALLDVNRDRRLDLVLANFPMEIMDENGNPIASLSGQNAIFINNGEGHFSDETASRNSTLVQDMTVEIAPGDVDKDGDIDLFLANVGFSLEENLNRLLVNNGQGVFTDESLTRLPAETVSWNNDAALADFNGDGAVDIFMPSVEPGVIAGDLLYVNDGAGRFSDRSEADLPEVLDFSAAAAVGDVDGDANLDIFIANVTPFLTDSVGAQNRLYKNTSISTAVDFTEFDPNPRSFQLFSSYPNPFSALTTLRFTLPSPSAVRLEIYNLLGQIVRTLVDEWRPSGEYRILWDGRDDNGRHLPGGVYLYRFDAGAFHQTGKFILLQ